MHTYKKVDAINYLASHCSYDSRMTAVKTTIIIINRILKLKKQQQGETEKFLLFWEFT